MHTAVAQHVTIIILKFGEKEGLCGYCFDVCKNERERDILGEAHQQYHWQYHMILL